jgi:hypothetical protein
VCTAREFAVEQQRRRRVKLKLVVFSGNMGDETVTRQRWKGGEGDAYEMMQKMTNEEKRRRKPESGRIISKGHKGRLGAEVEGRRSAARANHNERRWEKGRLTREKERIKMYKCSFRGVSGEDG